jgi:hypothetical protein
MEYWINGKMRRKKHIIPLTHYSIFKKGRHFPHPPSKASVIARSVSDEAIR